MIVAIRSRVGREPQKHWLCTLVGKRYFYHAQLVVVMVWVLIAPFS